MPLASEQYLCFVFFSRIYRKKVICPFRGVNSLFMSTVVIWLVLDHENDPTDTAGTVRIPHSRIFSDT